MPKPFSIQTLEAAGKTVYLAEAGGCRAESPLLLTFLSPQEAAGLAALLPDVPLRLAAVDEPDWEASFTPWPAPRAFKGGADFGGGADAYLAMLEQKLLPQLEAELAIKPVWRGLAGFRWAGCWRLMRPTAAARSAVWRRCRLRCGLTAGRSLPPHTLSIRRRSGRIFRWAIRRKTAGIRAWLAWRKISAPRRNAGGSGACP